MVCQCEGLDVQPGGDLVELVLTELRTDSCGATLRSPADTDNVPLQVRQGEQERAAGEDGQHGDSRPHSARHRETQPDGDMCRALLPLQGGSKR